MTPDVRKLVRAVVVVAASVLGEVVASRNLVTHDAIALGIGGHVAGLVVLVVATVVFRAFLVVFAPAWLVYRIVCVARGAFPALGRR